MYDGAKPNPNAINNKIKLQKLIKERLGKDKGEVVMASVAQKLFNEGRQEGRQEGRREGRQEGRQEGQTELVKAMAKNGIAVEQISFMTGLSLAQIRNLLSS